MSTVCPACHVRSPVRLARSEVCAACRSRAAWSRWEDLGEKLVIDRDAIVEAEARRGGEAAGERWWRHAAPIAPAVVSVALAGLSIWLVARLLAPREIGPVALLFADLRSASTHAVVGGVVCLAASLAALLWTRRGRHFRRFALLATELASAIVGAAASLVAGVSYLSPSGFGMDHGAMPSLRAPSGASSYMDRVRAATVVVLAPDRDGDARTMSMGTGAVIGAGPKSAFVVTCSHVAIPYLPAAAFRDPAAAKPVWVELADGRGAEGRVVWTARPPLDVAVIEVPLAGAPEPVPISADADAAVEGEPVFFVPNPYRHGWMIHHGAVVRRERHDTPAGVFNLLFTDLPVEHGDSGSGLFDAFGRLVGLNTWTQMGPDGPQGISLPSEAMRVIATAVRDGKIERLVELLSEKQIGGGSR